MAERRFTYKVDVDTASAKTAASAVKKIFADSISGGKNANKQEVSNRKLGLMQIKAGEMDEARTRKLGLMRKNAGEEDVARIRKLGQLQLQAGEEDVARIRKLGQLQLQAGEENVARIRKEGLMRKNADEEDVARTRKLGLMRKNADEEDVARTRKLGLMRKNADKEDVARTRKRQAEAQKLGRMQADASKMRQVDAQKLGRMQADAHKMNAAFDAKRKFSLGGALGGARGMIAGGIAGVGAAQAVRTASEMGQQGAGIIRITRSYEQLTAAIGMNADTLQGKMRDAVQGTVSDYAMLSRANLLLVTAQQGGVDVTEDQIETLAKFARLRSTQLTMEGKNLTTEEAFSRLIRGISKRESELLDELGVSTKQLASVTGKSVKEISGSVQGILDAVVQVAEADIGQFGMPIIDAAGRIEAAKASIVNDMDEIRKALSEPTADTFEWVSGAVGWLDDWREAFSALEVLQLIYAPDKTGAQKRSAESAKSLRDEFFSGKIGFSEYIKGLSEITLELGRLEDAFAFTRRQAELMDAQLGGRGGASPVRYTPPLLPPALGETSGPAHPDMLQAKVNQGLANFLVAQEEGREIAARIEDIKIDFARAEDARNKKMAKDATSAWKSAAKDTARAWKDAIGGIAGLPGVTGASPITQMQMDMAAAGLPVNFADNFTRRMNDELVNGVDYPEVTRGLVEQIVSATRGIPIGDLGGVSNELLAGMATEDISSGAALGTNLGQSLVDLLIDSDALQDSAVRQAKIQMGTEFVQRYVQDVLSEVGIDFANTSNPLADAIIGGFDPDSGTDIAGPSIAGMSSQFGNEKSTKGIKKMGEDFAAKLFSGFSGGVSEASWAQTIIGSIMDGLRKEMQAIHDGAGS
jgi:hypothetical protein